MCCRLKGAKKSEQYRLLWAEIMHLLEIGPQSANHKKLLTFIRNENAPDGRDSDKPAKRATIQPATPMSPPGSTDVTKKKSLIMQNQPGTK